MGSDQSSRPYRITEDLAEALSLRSGQLLRAHVVSRVSEEDNKLVIDVKGHQVLARSQLEVDEGQTLLVRVESLEQPIELKLFEPSQAGEELSESDLRSYLQSRNLDTSDETVEFLRTWLDESLPLGNSQFVRALESDQLSLQSADASPGDRLWAFCFLDERGFPITEESLDLVSRVNSFDESETWTRFFSQNTGCLSLESGNFNLRESVSLVGFDLVNRLGKRPKEASQTLHAKLLRKLKGKESELSISSATVKSLLGQILSVALVNLENREEFLFFVPLLQQGKIKLAWIGGRIKNEVDGWYLNAYLTLSELGSVGTTVEKSPGQLTVHLSSANREVRDRFRKHRDGLKNLLDRDEWSVSVGVTEESPSAGFDAFDLMNTSFKDQPTSFSRGLDLTV